MAINTGQTLAGRVLEFFNAVTDQYEIRHRIKDDPDFSSKSGSGYGITLSVARRILSVRNSLPGGQFDSIRQIDQVPGVGPITLHNILFSFQVWYGDPAPVVQEKLVILSATYGVTGKTNDVTQLLRSRILPPGKLVCPVDNSSLGGDPAIGMLKELKVNYSYAGEKVIPEHEILTLP